MTDERESFHAAIWRTPDDDLPRLVYADWLDERNEHDAATFLRLLCAVRTCPPDVDRLRPLVADFRRAMVKLPSKWIDDVCPVPPAVVVGPWVDADHEANHGVLNFIRSRRKSLPPRPGLRLLPPFRPEHEVRWQAERVVHRLWEELQPFLSPVAACGIEGVPALVDVWSGVVMATATGGSGYIVRVPEMLLGQAHLRTVSNLPTDWQGYRVRVSTAAGTEWAVGTESAVEESWLRHSATEFDPANRSG